MIIEYDSATSLPAYSSTSTSLLSVTSGTSDMQTELVTVSYDVTCSGTSYHCYESNEEYDSVVTCVDDEPRRSDEETDAEVKENNVRFERSTWVVKEDEPRVRLHKPAIFAVGKGNPHFFHVQ